MTQRRERRTHPRAKGTPGLTVDFEAKTPAAQVRDISRSGISFWTENPIEFMTKLSMTLVFPAEYDPKTKETSHTGIECEGAVVRCEPAEENTETLYDIAVFFTHLDEDAERMIAEYVDAHA